MSDLVTYGHSRGEKSADRRDVPPTACDGVTLSLVRDAVSIVRSEEVISSKKPRATQWLLRRHAVSYIKPGGWQGS